MGKVHVGDLLRIGHKLWYRIGCGPGMPGPYRVVVGELGGIGKVRGRHVRRPLRGGGGFVSDIGWAILTKLYRILTGFPLM